MGTSEIRGNLNESHSQLFDESQTKMDVVLFCRCNYILFTSLTKETPSLLECKVEISGNTLLLTQPFFIFSSSIWMCTLTLLNLHWCSSPNKFTMTMVWPWSKFVLLPAPTQVFFTCWTVTVQLLWYMEYDNPHPCHTYVNPIWDCRPLCSSNSLECSPLGP